MNILMERRWHMRIFDVKLFWEACSDTDHYLVFAEVRERLAASKQGAQAFDEERFNLGKQNNLEVRKWYQIKISYRFATLENFKIIVRT
jgi:hypothetical protein